MVRSSAGGVWCLAAVVAMTTVITACDPTAISESSTTSSHVPTTTTATTTIAEAATTLGPTIPPDDEQPPCATGDLAYVDAGNIDVGTGTGDAAEIAGIRWATDPSCDRLVIDLVTEGGSPASELGASDVEFRRHQGVVRATLPGRVIASALTDTLVGTRLITRVFVVRLLDGRLAIDLHLDSLSGAEIRAFAVDSPARLVIDVRSGSGGAITPPARSSRVVVLEPRPGDVEYPLVVTGYIAPGVRSVVAKMPSFNEEFPFIETEPALTATTWGEFTATFDIGPPGEVDLTVGPAGTEDTEGVRIVVRNF